MPHSPLDAPMPIDPSPPSPPSVPPIRTTWNVSVSWLSMLFYVALTPFNIMLWIYEENTTVFLNSNKMIFMLPTIIVLFFVCAFTLQQYWQWQRLTALYEKKGDFSYLYKINLENVIILYFVIPFMGILALYTFVEDNGWSVIFQTFPLKLHFWWLFVLTSSSLFQLCWLKYLQKLKAKIVDML